MDVHEIYLFNIIIDNRSLLVEASTFLVDFDQIQLINGTYCIKVYINVIYNKGKYFHF